MVYKKQLIKNICHIEKKLRNKSYSARKKLETSLLLTNKKHIEQNKIKKYFLALLSTMFNFQTVVKMTMLKLDGFGNL